MNAKIFGIELKDKLMKFKESHLSRKLERYEDFWVIKQGLPKNVLNELGELYIDYISEEDNKVDIILFSNPETLSYDKRRGSTVKMHILLKERNEDISVRFARDIKTPVYDTWFAQTHKNGTIPVFER